MRVSGGGGVKDFECSQRIIVSAACMSIFAGCLRLGTKSANLKAALFR